MSPTKNKIRNSETKLPFMEAQVKKRTSSSLPFGIRNSRGISLLFVVLIMSVILAISLGISGILIQQTRMLGKIGHSINAFYAADSGIERRLYDLYKLSPPYQQRYSAAVGDASFEAEIKCGASVIPENCPEGLEIASSEEECDALNFCLKSVGFYKETKRAIEIKY